MQPIGNIDFKNDEEWSFNKINSLSLFLVQEHGLSQDFSLYIDTNSFAELISSQSALRTYTQPNTITPADDITFYSANGLVKVRPTLDADHCIFDKDKVYIISKEVKEFNEDFEKLLNGE